jgi:hypothetical protein
MFVDVSCASSRVKPSTCYLAVGTEAQRADAVGVSLKETLELDADLCVPHADLSCCAHLTCGDNRLVRMKTRTDDVTVVPEKEPLPMIGLVADTLHDADGGSEINEFAITGQMNVTSAIGGPIAVDPFESKFGDGRRSIAGQL